MSNNLRTREHGMRTKALSASRSNESGGKGGYAQVAIPNIHK
jgi:hypothetical protein